MLEDLVKVMGSIGQYGAEQLRRQGVKPSTLRASALADLGYWHFSQGNYRQARNVFTSSLKAHLSKRALLYVTACLLPKTLITRLKVLKQQNISTAQ